MAWVHQFPNSLRYAYLFVRQIPGRYTLDVFGQGMGAEHEGHVHFDLNDSGQAIWREEHQNQAYTSMALATKYLKLTIDRCFDEPTAHEWAF
jgi:hypothetical protein